MTRDDLFSGDGLPGEVWPLDRVLEEAEKSKPFLHTYDNSDYAERFLIPAIQRLAAEIKRLGNVNKALKDKLHEYEGSPKGNITNEHREPGW